MATYRMKAVSRLTGIRPELLRMWEHRYRLFKPQRAGNRYREFDDEDVQLLLYLRQQIEQGRAIGELAAEGREALLRQSMALTVAPSPERAQTPSCIDELLSYVHLLDKGRLEARLAELAAFSTFATLLTTVTTPLLHRLGEAWANGEVSVVSGRFVTEIFKQRLLAMLHATARGAEAPRVVCACPAGEWHELGLLTFAYTIQQEGWQVYYLGANLPVQALLEGCQRLQPALVALSLTDSVDGLDVLHELESHLAGIYPTIIGGQAAEGSTPMGPFRHLRLCETLAGGLQQGRSLRTKAALWQPEETSEIIDSRGGNWYSAW